MKKKIMIIQIIQTVFIAFLIAIALLQNSGIITTNKSLMPVYVFSTLASIALLILFIVLKQNKLKNGTMIVFILLSIELVITAIFCGNIDNRIDKIRFRKQCGKTEATIYKIVEEKKWDNKAEKEEKKYIYYFSYDAMGETNSSSFTGSSYKKYSEGDVIDIYYNKENPEDYRLDIGYAKNEFLILTLILLFGLKIFEIVYTKKYEIEEI